MRKTGNQNKGGCVHEDKIFEKQSLRSQKVRVVGAGKRAQVARWSQRKLVRDPIGVKGPRTNQRRRRETGTESREYHDDGGQRLLTETRKV